MYLGMEIGTVNFDDLFDFSPEPQPALVDPADAQENAAFARLQTTSASSDGKNYYTLQTQQHQQQQRRQEQSHPQQQQQQQQQQQHQLYQGRSGSEQRTQQQQISPYSNSYCTNTPQQASQVRN
jgi:hypothetical protein